MSEVWRMSLSIAKLPRAFWQQPRQRLPALRHGRFSAAQLSSTAHIIDEPVDEELLPGDRLIYFHPTRPGEILDDRFRTIAKVGYGTGSTVWLAENLHFGSPEATENTKDPWHASVAFRRKEDFKGSGVSLHVYPDGTVIPSKAEFPPYKISAATPEELGKENARWLDPDYVTAWQAAAVETTSCDKKGKGKARSQSTRPSSSKQRRSSGRHDPSSASGSGGKGEVDDYSQ